LNCEKGNIDNLADGRQSVAQVSSRLSAASDKEAELMETAIASLK